MVQLTRYLCYKDEVKLTFIENLLNQKNLNECYFWIYEYYKSGYVEESWNLLYKIYFDFYALKNPKYLKKINKCYNSFKNDNNIKYLLSIVKNLFKFNKNYKIFILRTYYSSICRSILECKITYIDNFTFTNEYQIKLVNAINQKDYELSSYYLNKLINDENIINLISSILKKDIEIYSHYDKYHQLLFIILNSFKIQKKKKTFYMKVKDEEINKVLESNEYNFDNKIIKWLENSPNNFNKIFPNPKKQIKFITSKSYEEISEALENLWRDKDKCSKEESESLIYMGKIMNDILLYLENPYKILKTKRLFSISKNIGCFQLDRNKLDVSNIQWYNWEYYAYKSPIWQKRFDNYNIKVNHIKKTIRFKNIDEEEKFYEKYNYEPDEQSKETQEKSILKIKKNSIKNWLNLSFKEKIKKNIRIRLKY